MAEVPKLGRLDEVDLRSVWNSEPYSFTPWLAQPENLQFLSETLDLPGLELVRTEHPVDAYSADIVCKIVGTDHFVLIENQLERTDHTHLGQLLTYAPKFDAQAVIWVARQFTDAHRAALDWLNRITSDTYGFFGVEVRAVRIGDSEPAPLFDIVSSPNDWIKPSSFSAGVSPQLVMENNDNIAFWGLLDEALAQNGMVQRKVRKQVKGPNLWIPLTTDGAAYIVCYRMLGRKPGVGVYLGLYGQNHDFYFDEVQNLQPTINRIFDNKLRLETNGSRTVHKALTDQQHSSPDQKNWPEQIEWLVTEINKFVQAFGQPLKTIDASLRGLPTT